MIDDPPEIIEYPEPGEYMAAVDTVTTTSGNPGAAEAVNLDSDFRVALLENGNILFVESEHVEELRCGTGNEARANTASGVDGNAADGVRGCGAGFEGFDLSFLIDPDGSFEMNICHQAAEGCSRVTGMLVGTISEEEATQFWSPPEGTITRFGGIHDIPVVKQTDSETDVFSHAGYTRFLMRRLFNSPPRANQRRAVETTNELTITESTVLKLIVDPNEGAESREAEIQVGPHTYTLTQLGTGALEPQIKQNGVVEGANFTGAISSNGWASINGAFKAPRTRLWAATDFDGSNLPESLDGISVTVNGKPAFVEYISGNQINMLVDDDETVGLVDVVVTTPNGKSLTEQVLKQEFTPQMFRFDPQAREFAAAVGLDGSYLGPADLFGGAVATRPVRPGELGQYYGAGWGPTNPPTPAGQLVPAPVTLANEPSFTMGGMPVEVQFHGLVGRGLYQFNLYTPQLADGIYKLEGEIAGVPMDPVLVAVERE